MSKRRFTRSLQKNNHENLIEYEFDQQVEKIATKTQDSSKVKQRPKKLLNEPQIQQSMPKKIKEQNNQDSSSILEQSSRAGTSLNIKKKKLNKKQQNEGIRILQEKESQRIFQHLCTPQGVITVESLGRVMVRAKKQFQMEDLQNMIAYYDTIKKRLQLGDKIEQKDKKSKIQQNRGISQIVSKRATKKTNLSRQFQDSQNSYQMSQNRASDSELQEQNYEDNLDQSLQGQLDMNCEEDYKTELNYEEFRILKGYFEK